MINKNKIHSYFRNNFKLTQSTRGWYRFKNPFDLRHEDESAAINFNTGVVKDHRTGYITNVINFIMKYEDNISYLEAKELVNSYNESELDLTFIKEVKRAENVVLPEGFSSILEGNGALGNKARNYLKDRKFDLEKLDFKGFGYINDRESKFYGYIIIPFKSDGILKYYIGRNFLEDFRPKYRNPEAEHVGVGKSEIFYNEDCINLYDQVFLTEGWADSETIGDNSVASLGWSLSSTQKSKLIKSNCKELIIVPDKGLLENSNLTFYQKALQIGLQFTDYKKVKVVNTENICKEDEKKKDVNEFGLDLLLEELEKTPYLTYSFAINNL